MRGPTGWVRRWTDLLRLGTLALSTLLAVQTLVLLAGGHFAATEPDFRASFVLYTLGTLLFPLYVFQVLRRASPHPPLSWRRLGLLGLITALAIAVVTCTLPPSLHLSGEAPRSPLGLWPITLPEIQHYLVDVAAREEIERAGLLAGLGGGTVGSVASSTLFMLAHLRYAREVSFWTGLNILLTKLYLGVILYGVLRSAGVLCAVLLVQVHVPLLTSLLLNPQARLLLCALLFTWATLLLRRLTQLDLGRPEGPAPLAQSSGPQWTESGR